MKKVGREEEKRNHKLFIFSGYFFIIYLQRSSIKQKKVIYRPKDAYSSWKNKNKSSQKKMLTWLEKILRLKSFLLSTSRKRLPILHFYFRWSIVLFFLYFYFFLFLHFIGVIFLVNRLQSIRDTFPSITLSNLKPWLLFLDIIFIKFQNKFIFFFRLRLQRVILAKKKKKIISYLLVNFNQSLQNLPEDFITQTKRLGQGTEDREDQKQRKEDGEWQYKETQQADKSR